MAQADSPPLPATGAKVDDLPRVLGLFDAVTVVVGSIIGSGIFLSKVGNVARDLHSFGPIIAVWVGVGIVTLCGSLALAELAAMYPRAGGPYVYLREAYGPLPAFLWGWTEFWVIRTGSIGALACATVIYLDAFHPLPSYLHAWVAVAIVLGLSAINFYGTRWGAAVQNVTTVIKVGFLLAIITLPWLMGKTSVSNLEIVWPANYSWDFAKMIGVAMVAVLWPYDGWINLAPVAEEIRDPQKNIPRGLALGMLIVIFVYVGANVSYHFTLPMDKIAFGVMDAQGNAGPTSTIASDLFGALFGERGAQIAALGVMCSTFGAVNSNMLTGPRIYLAMARDGYLPAQVHAVHIRYQTPGNAVKLQAVWTTALLIAFYSLESNPREVFEKMTDSVIFAGLFFYGMTVAAVYVLRRTQPGLNRPYRTWGYPVTPALLLIAYSVAAVSVLRDQPGVTQYVAALIGLGIVYYYIARMVKNRKTADSARETTDPGIDADSNVQPS